MSNIYILEDSIHRIALFKKYIPNGKYFTEAHEMIKALSNLPADEHIDILFLDHDLGGEVYVDSSREDCGMEVARWLAIQRLVNPPINIKHIVVHSWNIPAARKMTECLSSLQQVHAYRLRQQVFSEALLRLYLEYYD